MRGTWLGVVLWCGLLLLAEGKVRAPGSFVSSAVAQMTNKAVMELIKKQTISALEHLDVKASVEKALSTPVIDEFAPQAESLLDSFPDPEKILSGPLFEVAEAILERLSGETCPTQITQIVELEATRRGMRPLKDKKCAVYGVELTFLIVQVTLAVCAEDSELHNMFYGISGGFTIPLADVVRRTRGKGTIARDSLTWMDAITPFIGLSFVGMPDAELYPGFDVSFTVGHKKYIGVTVVLGLDGSGLSYEGVKIPFNYLATKYCKGRSEKRICKSALTEAADSSAVQISDASSGGTSTRYDYLPFVDTSGWAIHFLALYPSVPRSVDLAVTVNSY